jgi:hypothetical protein
MVHSTRFWLLPAAFVLSTACTAFFPPDEKDDGVTRCDNVEDCEAPDDIRFDIECVFGEDQDESSPKVCAPKFFERSCDPERYAMDPFFEIWTEAQGVSGVYVACDEDKRGSRGCKRRPNGMGTPCDDGLEENQFEVCDDPDADYAAIEANADRKGFDVKDQFCRSMFCESDWVCNDDLCKPCDPDSSPGEGGCVELYINGERSSVYVDEIDCDSGPKPEDAKFGDVPAGN